MRLAVLLIVALLAACASPAPGRSPEVPPGPSSVVAPPPASGDEQDAPWLPRQELSLSFQRGFWHMEGTLTLPARREGERVPAAVIVHGSGPMSRDGVMRGQLGLGFGFELGAVPAVDWKQSQIPAGS